MMVIASPPLQGQVALVTGGASGLGAAIAAVLAARGARVAITDVNKAGLAAAGESFIRLRADTRSVAEVKAAVVHLTAQTGRVDILLNNAGISGYSRLLEAIDETDFDAMLATHVKGAFFSLRPSWPA